MHKVNSPLEIAAYSAMTFVATTRDEFRRGLIAAIEADLALDVSRVEPREPGVSFEQAAYNEQIREGVIRHGVTVNGRRIHYAAQINSNGHATVTDLQVAGRDLSRAPRRLKTIEELRAAADAAGWARGTLGSVGR